MKKKNTQKKASTQTNAQGTQATANLIAQAVSCHQVGRTLETKNLYEQILALDSRHVDALNGLGTLYLQNGHLQEAAQLLERSLVLNPHQPIAQMNIGNALRGLGRFDDALAAYDHAIASKPDFVAAYFNRGNVLNDLMRAEEAVSSYERAIAMKPDYIQAYFNRGNTLKALGRLEEAIDSYDRAIALKPDYAEAYYNRGYVLNDLRRFDEALADCDRIVALMPNFAGAQYNRGNALLEIGRFEEAVASYNRALSLDPNNIQALCNRGNALRQLKRLDEALVSYGRAIELNPNFASAHNNRGSVLLTLNRFEEAMECYAQAMMVEPDFPYALGSWQHCKMHCCDWGGIKETFSRISTGVDRGERVVMPFLFLSMPSTPEQQLQCASIYVRDKYPTSANAPLGGCAAAHERIRIGYFSSDFRSHAMAYLIADMIERHDRSRFEVIAFSYSGLSDAPIRERLEKCFDRFVDVTTMPDRDVVALARRSKVDIAIDLNGFTANNRAGIFAARVAPIQVNHLGYPGTLGDGFADYIIADRTVIPPEHHAYYSEQIVSLPDTYWFNDAAKVISDRVFNRAELNLPETAFVFCCFNNAYKITPDAFGIWMRLLSAVDGSVLWLLESTVAATVNLRREAGKWGVDPDRLVFAPRMGMDEHLARHRHADLFLDTFYYNAHTTTSDALWAGLPVLTCLGDTFAGRVAASLLKAVGLPEMITDSRADYETLALQLAKQPDRLADIRRRLDENRRTAALFDTARYTRHIESAYLTMYERHQAGRPPKQIVIDA